MNLSSRPAEVVFESSPAHAVGLEVLLREVGNEWQRALALLPPPLFFSLSR
jgi:hypothetical protein